MNQDASKNVFKKGADWCLSPAGITIILAVAVALYAAADKGAYVLVNTAVTGGM